jgi:uncharacterized protein
LNFRPKNAGTFELAALAVSAIAKFIVMDWLEMRAFYITSSSLFWLWYVYYRYKKDKTILKYWGFKKSDFYESWKILLPFFILSSTLAVLYARNNGIPVFQLNIIPVLVLYPVWGLIQQFIFLCIIALNLKQLRFFSKNKGALFLLVSFLFSLIHYPDYYLMGITFVMELVFLLSFWKWRNLWAIGIAHGIMATFLLHYVFGRDLWQELFAWF